MGSPVSSFLAKPAIRGTALRIPAADLATRRIYTSFLNISTAGFSSYRPVMASTPACSLAVLHTSPQAMPKRPALKAGPAMMRSG